MIRTGSAEEAELARRVAHAVKNGSDRLFEKPKGKKSAFVPGAVVTEPLPEDNVGRQLLKKQGWEPPVDPVTGAVVEEAPVPIPGTIPGRAGLGAYDRETARLAHAAASSADDGVDELVDRQSKLLSMMGLRASGSLRQTLHHLRSPNQEEVLAPWRRRVLVAPHASRKPS